VFWLPFTQFGSIVQALRKELLAVRNWEALFHFHFKVLLMREKAPGRAHKSISQNCKFWL